MVISKILSRLHTMLKMAFRLKLFSLSLNTNGKLKRAPFTYKKKKLFFCLCFANVLFSLFTREDKVDLRLK